MDRAPQRVDGMALSDNIQQQHHQNIQQQQQQQRAQPQIRAPGALPEVVQDMNTLGSTAGQSMSQQPRGATNAMTTSLMMNLMTNPALAAAAAASLLFPPAAMLSNPGAFLAMPEASKLDKSITSEPDRL